MLSASLIALNSRLMWGLLFRESLNAEVKNALRRHLLTKTIFELGFVIFCAFLQLLGCLQFSHGLRTPSEPVAGALGNNQSCTRLRFPLAFPSGPTPGTLMSGYYARLIMSSLEGEENKGDPGYHELQRSENPQVTKCKIMQRFRRSWFNLTMYDS